jgi:hypothetical protein
MADNSGIKFLKYYLQKLKSFFLSKDILSFLLFFALSSVFWFVNALGKERETIITIPIRYTGVPPNIAITNNPPTEISLNVKDQGLRLFDYSKSHIIPLTIDLKRNFYEKGEILITSDQLNAKIGRYIMASTTLLEVNPDSIIVQYMKLSQTTLPIELVSSIELAPQYMLTDKIHLDPARIIVFGPKKVLSKLKSIQTECLEVKNLNDTNSFRCKLKQIKSVRYSTKEINVKLFVEQFTEKKVQIPITAVNCPDNLYIRSFPAFVIATYTVGLSYFNSLIPNDIQVLLDYNDIKSGDLSKQKLKIINNSSHISNIRISPQEVEFIMEEK